MSKKIVERLHPTCSLEGCPRQGKPMDVVVYEDGTYRGGHSFRGISEIVGFEYWECPQCYWGKNQRGLAAQGTSGCLAQVSGNCEPQPQPAGPGLAP